MVGTHVCVLAEEALERVSAEEAPVGAAEKELLGHRAERSPEQVVERDPEAGLRALDAPAWAIRDVSQDPRYQGGTLVRDGIPGD